MLFINQAQVGRSVIFIILIAIPKILMISHKLYNGYFSIYMCDAHTTNEMERMQSYRVIH